MKPFPSIKSAIILFLICLLSLSCEKLKVKHIILDNRSNYTVTVELYTGNDDSQGYMIYEDYSVSAHTTKDVESETFMVYVDGYRPSESVNMEIDDSKIIFTDY